jgi:hypothetical protein
MSFQTKLVEHIFSEPVDNGRCIYGDVGKSD